mmetsp:Transcript_10985/g.16605  ORF Transcript_10985/g.16605 Transcript_10985/m.16605 type:complete len:176 (+) Transcript_10985:261-788(+)|eukprot:CAMPEP_0202699536 /NCGR_PEP_ID=MMETSP1385-20130828/12775_1 /ASSEMBLY_ACC=CAM_ASM_000861 /TAXON_ID=933848 /ORGANISM="Elphidium margaritaceum" /LENGTH=175 /DNA_ID=CAMNT_0049356511 /DNA_START=189 /DNA_END=716 /DNA_ORIENTATION=+
MTSDHDYKHNDNPLSNDPIIVNDEIDRLHRKIFHLRRTNTEIRKYYSDDADCAQALQENLIVIDHTLQALFVQFELYQQLCNKQHFYIKLYESDLKMRDKLNSFTSFQNDPSQSLSQQQQHSSVKKLKEFDLDYVAQKLKEKTKELQAAKTQTQTQTKDDDNDTNNDDDDGGFTL